MSKESSSLRGTIRLPGELPSFQGCVRLALLAAVLSLACLAARPATAQEGTGLTVIEGRVVDDASGDPVEGAEIQLLGGDDTGFQGTTDDQGAFVFQRVPPGVYQLVVEHPEYGTRSSGIALAGRELVMLNVRLQVQPIELAPLVVSVRREFLSPTMQEFYERKEKGLGRYITRADIEQRQPGRITHMIASLPGISLIRGGSSVNPKLHFRRHQRYIPGRGAVPCWPTVYVDGKRIQEGGPDPANWDPTETDIDDMVLPGDIAGVEVYDGAGGVPPRFGGSWGGCGVIVIWTRSAP